MTRSEFDAAKQLVEAYIPDDCGLLDSATQELPEGWYFCFQSKTYLETGSAMDMLVGSGGLIVERDGGRIVELGSAHPLDINLKAYRAGLLYGAVDLTLVNVHDEEAAAAALVAIGISYVTPEYESGEVWRIAKHYTIHQISYLMSPMTVFGGVHLDPGHLEALEALKESCEYSLSPPADSVLDRLRCTQCKGTIVIPKAAADDWRAVAELRSADPVKAMRAIENRMGLDHREAKRLAIHLTLVSGVCHRCGEVLPTTQPIQCTDCRTLNVDWLSTDEV